MEDVIDRAKRKVTPTEADNAWNDVLNVFFEPFIRLCWPEKHSLIDWSKKLVTLEKNFSNIDNSRKKGKKNLDKLIQSSRTNGIEILLHIEVEGNSPLSIPKRLFKYFYRIYERYPDKDINCLVIYIDGNEHLRPNIFSMDCSLGFSFNMKFPIIDILKFKRISKELEENRNPFATVILTQLAAIEAGTNEEKRLIALIKLVKELLKKEFEPIDVYHLTKFMEAVLAVSESKLLYYYDEIKKFEEAQKMAFMTIAERIGMEQGVQKGIKIGEQKGIALGRKQGEYTVLLSLLESKFNTLPKQYASLLQSADADQLLVWAKKLLWANTIEEVFN